MAAESPRGMQPVAVRGGIGDWHAMHAGHAEAFSLGGRFVRMPKTRQHRGQRVGYARSRHATAVDAPIPRFLRAGVVALGYEQGKLKHLTAT
jgi:hypothetical protein